MTTPKTATATSWLPTDVWESRPRPRRSTAATVQPWPGGDSRPRRRPRRPIKRRRAADPSITFLIRRRRDTFTPPRTRRRAGPMLLVAIPGFLHVAQHDEACPLA